MRALSFSPQRATRTHPRSVQVQEKFPCSPLWIANVSWTPRRSLHRGIRTLAIPIVSLPFLLGLCRAGHGRSAPLSPVEVGAKGSAFARHFCLSGRRDGPAGERRWEKGEETGSLCECSQSVPYMFPLCSLHHVPRKPAYLLRFAVLFPVFPWFCNSARVENCRRPALAAAGMDSVPLLRTRFGS